MILADYTINLDYEDTKYPVKFGKLPDQEAPGPQGWEYYWDSRYPRWCSSVPDRCVGFVVLRANMESITNICTIEFVSNDQGNYGG